MLADLSTPPEKGRAELVVHSTPPSRDEGAAEGGRAAYGPREVVPPPSLASELSEADKALKHFPRIHGKSSSSFSCWQLS